MPTRSFGEELPSFIKLQKKGLLDQRVDQLYSIYEECHLCPRDCRVNRIEGQTGKCQATAKVKVSSAAPHFGEEAPLVGRGGSGTVFFSNCNLRCVYCQNYTISIEGEGIEIVDRRLAETMIKLQKMGCSNINLVTPTHYLPSIVRALQMAIPMGLRIPLVYNTSGYEKLEIIQMLDGIVDIYLPDCKYMDPSLAAKYSDEAYNYPHYAKIALKEMFRQVGDLQVHRGIAVRGLIVRHLVLPNGISGTKEFLKFVATQLSKTTYINIMRQYRPEHRAFEYPELSRRITQKEYSQALGWAKQYGLQRLDR
ncbi:MAG: radical SAM protein [Candidatus Aminicenantes bacterium]|nr:MAG: radical SAM protein [Candidatus Aminicenantes bacterium]